MDHSNRRQRLFGLGAGMLSSQVLFLFSLVSAPESAPVHGAYLVACISAAISIPLLAFALVEIASGDVEKVLAPAGLGAASAAVTIGATLWHFSHSAGIAAVVTLVVLFRFEKRLSSISKAEPSPAAIRELREKHRGIAERRAALKRLRSK